MNRPTQDEADRITIAAFETRDLDGVLHVILPIQQHEFEIAITASDQPDLQEIATFYQMGRGGFWVAKLDGTVIGTIALKDIGERRGALRKMFVSATYRGAAFGVGQRLLDHLSAAARNRGITDLYLGTTEKFVAAHRFYEKNRFQRIAREELPISFPIVPVDTRFYRLSLNSKI